MSKLRLGIIGTNFISDQLCDAVRRAELFELTAVLSRTKERGEHYAAQQGIVHAYTDAEEFFASGIDAVYVASPNSLHAEYSLAAIEHGLHVLCEKPTASNAAEYAKMRDAARAAHLVLLEAMRPAFDPALAAVKRALPRIGRVRRASLEFCQYSSRYDKFRAGEVLRAFDSTYSNAAVMDIGVYPIHFCLRLFGKPSGQLSSRSIILDNGFEGSGELMLPYDGMTAVISYAKTFDSHTPSVIAGEDGAILIDKLSAPKDIFLELRDGTRERLCFEYCENNMTFELAELSRLIGDGKAEHEHDMYSEAELEIIDEIRRQNGIVFPADRA